MQAQQPQRSPNAICAKCANAHLPPPPHTRAHTFELSAEEELSQPQRPRCILTIELERIGEYNQHLHWGVII